MAKTEQDALATKITIDSKDWQPYAGFGASDLLGQDGDFHGIITAARAGYTGEGTDKEKVQVLLSIDVLDADEAGKHLNRGVFMTGLDSKGNAMIRQAYEALFACTKDDGTHVYDADFIHGIHGRGTTVAELTSLLVGKKICFSTTAKYVESGSGTAKVWKPISEITNFIAPDRYRTATKAPSRVAYNLGQPPAAAPAGFQNGAPGLPPGVPMNAGPSGGGLFGGGQPAVGGLATSGISASPAPSLGLGPTAGGLGHGPMAGGLVNGTAPAARAGDPLLQQVR